MSNIDIPAVLAVIRPGAAWRRANTYQDLVDTWEDDQQSVPTETELFDGWAVVVSARDDEARAAALAEIDRQAEQQRQKYITPGAGQAMSYQVKAEQAADCLANYTAASPPTPGTYLLLDSEVGVMANADATLTADAYEVAVVVDATRAAWLQAEAAINGTRVQAKADVKAAVDNADVKAIVAAIIWP